MFCSFYKSDLKKRKYNIYKMSTLEEQMPELQNITQQAGLHGFWKMRKPELIQFLIKNKLGND